MDMENDMTNRWSRRDLKRKSKKQFVSDNRGSVRWLYQNAGRKAEQGRRHEDNTHNLP